MPVHVYCNWSDDWLSARLDHKQRLVIWRNGSVSFEVEICLSGPDVAHLEKVKRWGYRKVHGGIMTRKRYIQLETADGGKLSVTAAADPAHCLIVRQGKGHTKLTPDQAEDLGQALLDYAREAREKERC